MQVTGGWSIKSNVCGEWDICHKEFTFHGYVEPGGRARKKVTRIECLAGKFSVVLVGMWVFFCGCVNAEGASWKYFFFSKDNKITYYYDAESITFPSPEDVRVWIKQVDQYEEYRKSHVELNCKEKTYTFLAIISYTKEDRVIYGSTYSPKWESFPAGSVLNFLNTILCPLSDRNNKPNNK